MTPPMSRNQEKAMFAKLSKEHGSFGLSVRDDFFAVDTEGEAIAQVERVNELLQQKKKATIGDIKKIIEKKDRKEPLAEFELDDIFDKITPQNLDKVAEDNIEYVLKREKFLPKGYSVLVSHATGLVDYRIPQTEEEEKEEGGFYQVDFEVFSDPNTVKYAGTAYGKIEAQEILDMTVDIYKWE